MHIHSSNCGSVSHKLILTLLTLILAACGGGSSTPSNNNPAAKITSLIPVGVVASTTPKQLSIGGTNFVSGMTVSVTDKNGASYPVNSVTISSSTVITASVDIATVPADNYLNVTVIPTNNTQPATTVLGVAGTNPTLAADVQSIFSTKCGTCHTGTSADYLNLSSYAATAAGNSTGLIGIPSYLCAPKFRVVPGDPRRSSSVLIDKIQVAASGQAACNGNLPMPPISSPPLTPAEIKTIIDWVAMGAN